MKPYHRLLLIGLLACASAAQAMPNAFWPFGFTFPGPHIAGGFGARQPDPVPLRQAYASYAVLGDAGHRLGRTSKPTSPFMETALSTTAKQAPGAR